jgi:hypothetical protein
MRAINAARLSLDSLIADIRRNPLRFVFCRTRSRPGPPVRGRNSPALRRLLPARLWRRRHRSGEIARRRRRLHDDPTHYALRIVQLDLELEPLSSSTSIDTIRVRTATRPAPAPASRRSEQRLRRLPAALQRTRHLHQPQPVRLVAQLVRVASLIRAASVAVVACHAASTLGNIYERGRIFGATPGAVKPPAPRPARCDRPADPCLPTGQRNTLDRRFARW